MRCGHRLDHRDPVSRRGKDSRRAPKLIQLRGERGHERISASQCRYLPPEATPAHVPPYTPDIDHFGVLAVVCTYHVGMPARELELQIRSMRLEPV
jgi:hypothetical protein